MEAITLVSLPILTTTKESYLSGHEVRVSDVSDITTADYIPPTIIKNQLVWLIDFIRGNQLSEGFKDQLYQKWQIKRRITKLGRNCMLISCYGGYWSLPIQKSRLIQRWQIDNFSFLVDEFVVLYEQASFRGAI